MFIKVSSKIAPLMYTCGRRSYADIAPKKFAAGSMTKKKELPVESDPYKLVEYVCGTNILKEGGEHVKIKPESEYPDWLWELHLGPRPKLKELDPETIEYWEKVRKLAIRRKIRLSKLKPIRYY